MHFDSGKQPFSATTPSPTPSEPDANGSTIGVGRGRTLSEGAAGEECFIRKSFSSSYKGG